MRCLLLVLCLNLLAAIARAQAPAFTLSLNGNSVHYNDAVDETCLALNDKVIITATFAPGEKALDLFNTIDAKLCAGKLIKGKAEGRRALLYYQNGVQVAFGGGSANVKKNMLQYSFMPQKFTECYDESFYLFFTYR